MSYNRNNSKLRWALHPGDTLRGTLAQKLIHTYVHYLSKVWGHLEMSLFLKEKHVFLSIKKHQIDQKYSVDMVNVVNDYCSWKQLILMEYLHRGTEAHYQQPSLLCSNGM
jgi:hypothetical protein